MGLLPATKGDLVGKGAALGVETASAGEATAREMVAWLESASAGRRALSLYDYHQRKIGKGAASSGGGGSGEERPEVLPSSADMCQALLATKKPVPRYLLPPHHAKHIPPHIVAFDLIRRQEDLQVRCWHGSYRDRGPSLQRRPRIRSRTVSRVTARALRQFQFVSVMICSGLCVLVLHDRLRGRAVCW